MSRHPVELLSEFEGQLLTIWPVIGESCSLVPERLQVVNL